MTLDLGMGTLAYDYRIIHHYPQHQNKGEQGQHVDRQAKRFHRHQRHGAEEAHRQPQHNPEGQFQIQEQCQDNEHQQGTHKHVGQHHVEAALEIVG